MATASVGSPPPLASTGAPRRRAGGGAGSSSEKGRATRAQILEVALAQFSERGYEGASLRSIAEAAGVDHPLVKYHFADKDTLWRDAVRFLFDRMNAEIRQAPRAQFAEDPEKAFTDMIRALVRYNARHPEHARLMVLESVRDSDRIRWAAETLVRRQHTAIGPWLDAAIARGFLPDLPRHELVTMVNALCHITFTLEPMVRHSWSVEVRSEEAIEAHVRAVLALLGFNRTPAGAR